MGDSKNEASETPRCPVTIVTGCSRGIGQALAEHLAADLGHTVIATLRDVSKAPASLVAAGCELHTLDVTNDASVATLASHMQEKHGGVDIVVNNAGYGVPGSCDTIPLAQQQDLFDTNVWGVIRLAQALLPQMRSRGGGVFLAVSSVAGVRSFCGGDVYCGSKRALEGLLEGLRYSVARDGVRVALVNPGPVSTGFVSRFRAEGVQADEAPVKEAQHSSGDKSSRYVDWLDSLIANKGQSARSCAEAIARVLSRDWDAVCRGDTSLAQFWNGTDEASQAVVDSVKRYPDGRSGVYAEKFAEAEKLLGGKAEEE